MKIYFNEYNLLMGSGGIVYLPFVSGILSAAYKVHPELKEAYDTMPFIFRPAPADEILMQYENPDIVTFSISMWNEQLSLEVARKVKESWPDCTIIFGGAQCPHNPYEYMVKYKFIDVCVRAEGEEAFVEYLKCKIGKVNLSSVPNISYRQGDEIITNSHSASYSKSLDKYPSPYLTGEFDYLLKKENHNLQAIVETNRGCPFLCTFCYWGKGGSTTKYRFRGLDIVFAEIEYLARHKVGYVFNADSNFGMHRRDYQIALKLVECKQKYGFPEKFRTCWGKNTSERIFKIASLLQYYGLDKGVTLARQSNSSEVLKNIKRDNIKLDSYSKLESSFNELQVPVYAELILGLPGETTDSWLDGIDQMLEAGINNQLFIYQAEVYPNTELAAPAYQEMYKIKTKKIRLNEIHCTPRPENWTHEFQEIVIGNYSQTTEDWKFMTSVGTMTMLLHSMKTGIFLLAFLRRYCDISYKQILTDIMSAPSALLTKLRSMNTEYVNNLLEGSGRGILKDKYSDVYLEIEEVQLLYLLDVRSEFYGELDELFANKVPNKLRPFWRDLIKFQEMSLPLYSNQESILECKFETNVVEFCAKLFTSQAVEPSSESSFAVFKRPAYSDLHEFTRKQVIWARKSGLIIYKTEFEKDFAEKIKKEFIVEDISDEKSIKINVLEVDREKFVPFKAFKN